MNILAFDTCFGACSAAARRGLGSGHARAEARFEEMETGHAERLVPMIGEVLEALGIGVHGLDRIAVTIGPGTFTGTRIGIAAARAFAVSNGIPVVGFTSLEAMAHSREIGVVPEGFDLAVVTDARREAVYAQLFDGVTLLPKTGAALLSPEDAALLGGTLPVVYAGSAAESVVRLAAESGRNSRIVAPGLLPRIGDALLRAAELTPQTGSVKPLYLRPPDAKPQTSKSLARA